MAVIRSMLLRFAFHYPICVLVLWAITGREWGGPGAVAAALFATIITTIMARHDRTSRRPPVQPLTLSADVARAEICDQLSDVSWLRANGMMLTASLLDTIGDLDTYVSENRLSGPAPSGPAVAFTYPCGCNVSTLTKGGHIVIPCAQHRNGGAPSTVPALMGSRPGLTFEEFGSTEREPCGCILQTVGPAHATAPGTARSVKYPCLQHQASCATTLLLWPPSPDPDVSRETGGEFARARADLEAKVKEVERNLVLERVVDEALDRAHGTRWMGAL